MQLPQALKPWSEWLEWFDPALLPGFADLLGRINPLLGPLLGRQHNGMPEPDGLGDLQRRGPYERLLSSEWLLAEELPDEFMRRAAGGEHLFVAPQYRARQANRMIVVLFDAGPMQLGASRLVHIALLILLARRAREAGAQFRWGILQSSPCLFELDSVAQIKHLLAERTFACVSDEHWRDWSDWLQEQPEPVGECWAVGQRLPMGHADPVCSHRVQVQRDLDGKSLSFELLGTGRSRVQLPMPDVGAGLRLLKGEFEGVMPVQARQTVVAPRVALTLPPVISSAGTHVALALLDEPGVVVIKLPGENQKKPLEIRRQFWSLGCYPLTMTFLSRTYGAVLSAENRLRFWKMPGLASVLKPSVDELKLPPGTATLLPAAWLRCRAAGRLYMLDTKGNLAYWSAEVSPPQPRPAIGRTHILADAVLGLAKVDHETMVYVRNQSGQLYVHTANARGDASASYMAGAAQGVSQVLFAAGLGWRRQFGTCALLISSTNGSESWRVLTASQQEQINLAPGWRGLGLLRNKGRDNCSMVMLGANQQSIAVYDEGQSEVLFTTTHPVVKSSFCPISGLVAVLTGARELLVYSVSLRRMRLQLFCNQIPDKDVRHA